MYLEMQSSWRIVLSKLRFDGNLAELGGGLRVELNDIQYAIGFERSNVEKQTQQALYPRGFHFDLANSVFLGNAASLMGGAISIEMQISKLLDMD